ncbi:MAG: hypothetical protein Q9160_004363 [Pyrenula sp. 1 TL-2023]
MAAVALPLGQQGANPPTRPHWNNHDITKPVNETTHTAHNVEAPNPQVCQLWRDMYGPFWGSIKDFAASGIQIRYGGPRNGSRQPPPGHPRRGIGIKWRNQGDTWNGLLNNRIRIQGLEFRLSQFGVLPAAAGTLKVPVMGMPPREPTTEMIQRVRGGADFAELDWFRYATLVKASTYFHEECLRCVNNTVTITISPAYEFEVAEAERDPEKGRNMGIRPYDNLYFIQLMPNELPSYVIYLTLTQQEVVNARLNTRVYRGLLSKGNNTAVHLQLGSDGKIPKEQIPAFKSTSMRTRTQTLRTRPGRIAAQPPSKVSKSALPSSPQAQTESTASWMGEEAPRTKVSSDKVAKSKAKPKPKPKNKSKVKELKTKSRSKKTKTKVKTKTKTKTRN